MIEPKIGDIMTLSGERYHIIEATDECLGCDLFPKCELHDVKLICDWEERQDEKSIIAKFIE